MATPVKWGSEILVNTTPTNDQNEPTITALADGRFAVAWRDESRTGGDTSAAAVRAQVFNADGSKFGGEMLVNTTTTNLQYQPTITALADGRFVVAWSDERNHCLGRGTFSHARDLPPGRSRNHCAL